MTVVGGQDEVVGVARALHATVQVVYEERYSARSYWPEPRQGPLGDVLLPWEEMTEAAREHFMFAAGVLREKLAA